jgi:hypothetical protein
MNGQSDNEQFARLIIALEPWLDQVVIIGGWAHRLYWLHPSAQRTEHLPLTTLDTDIAVPTSLKVTNNNQGTTHRPWIRRGTSRRQHSTCNTLPFRGR